MKLSELRDVVERAMISCPSDAEIVLSYEQDTLEDAFSLSRLESLKDIRVMDDWPLPGVSLVVPYETRDKLVVLFYGERDHASS
jgi:hypothetical protein